MQYDTDLDIEWEYCGVPNIPEEYREYFQQLIDAHDDYDAMLEADARGELTPPYIAPVGEDIEPGQPSAAIPESSYADAPEDHNVEWSKDDPKSLKVYLDPEWHGWELRGHGSIHVGYVPYRERPCLYVNKGGIKEILASFSSEEKARTMLEWLDRLVQVYAKVTYDS